VNFRVNERGRNGAGSSLTNIITNTSLVMIIVEASFSNSRDMLCKRQIFIKDDTLRAESTGESKREEQPKKSNEEVY